MAASKDGGQSSTHNNSVSETPNDDMTAPSVRLVTLFESGIGTVLKLCAGVRTHNGQIGRFHKGILGDVHHSITRQYDINTSCCISDLHSEHGNPVYVLVLKGSCVLAIRRAPTAPPGTIHFKYGIFHHKMIAGEFVRMCGASFSSAYTCALYTNNDGASVRVAYF